MRAPKLTPGPLTKGFVAALVRRASEWTPGNKVIETARKEGYDAGFKNGERHAKDRLFQGARRLGELETMMRNFEAASGIKISGWDAGRIGEAVRIIMNAPKRTALVAALHNSTKHLERALKTTREACDALNAQEVPPTRRERT